jgi:hypothetical protein
MGLTEAAEGLTGLSGGGREVAGVGKGDQVVGDGVDEPHGPGRSPARAHPAAASLRRLRVRMQPPDPGTCPLPPAAGPRALSTTRFAPVDDAPAGTRAA